MALWNSDPESLLATPGNYASKGQLEMAKEMMKSLQSDQKNAPPMRYRSQVIAHMINSLGEAGWGNVQANLANKTNRDAGAGLSNIAGTSDQPQTSVPGQGQNTPSPGSSPIPQGNTTSQGNAAQAAMTQTSSLGDSDTAPDDPLNKYREATKRSENVRLYEGKDKASKAAFDVDKYRNGFGTNSTNNDPSEVIDAATAHQRFNRDWDVSNSRVKNRYPGADWGSQQAMTSLDFNGGNGVYMGKDLDKAMLRYSQTQSPQDLAAAKAAFVQYNQSGGAYSPGLQNRRNREVNWFGQQAPQQAADTSPVKSATPGLSVENEGSPDEKRPLGEATKVKTIPIPGMSHVGAADADRDEREEVARAQQVAQNTQQPGQSQPATPANKPIQQTPGFTGPMPNVPYAATREAMDKFLRSSWAMDHPEIAKSMLENYQKRTDPYEMEHAGGKVQISPQSGGGGTAQFLPIGPGSPYSMGAGNASIHGQAIPKMDQQGNTTYKSNVPGTDNTGDLGGAKGVMQGLQEIGRTGETRAKILGGVAEQRQKLIGDAQHTNENLAHLNAISGISDLLPIDRSPTADNFIKAKEMIKEHFPNVWHDWGGDDNGLSGSEMMQKLNAHLASEETRNLSTRGPVFDFQTFLRTVPGNTQSKEGTGALASMLRQEEEAKREIALKVGLLSPEEMDKNPNIIANIQRQYYKENPIKMDLGGKTYHAQMYDNIEDVKKHVKVGEWYPRADKATGQTLIRQRTQ